MFYWNALGLADEEIAYQESLKISKVKEILGDKSRSLEKRISFLHFERNTDEYIARELLLAKSTFGEKNVKEIRKKLGLKSNSKPFSRYAFSPRSEPDPSH